MSSMVFFLDGDNKGQMIGGIPEHLREWSTVIPADVMWCGDEECCHRSEVQDEYLTYHIVRLGNCLRVATQDTTLAGNKDRLMFAVAEQAYYAWNRSVDAMYGRRVEQTAPAQKGGE